MMIIIILKDATQMSICYGCSELSWSQHAPDGSGRPQMHITKVRLIMGFGLTREKGTLFKFHWYMIH